MIAALRLIAVAGALSLMIGEAYRSWGAGRPVAFWMDDMLVGALLIVSAWAMRAPTSLRHAWFSASWGVATGMLYGSFFGKVFDPGSSDPGNFDLGLLTALIGIAFTVATVCTAMSIYAAGRVR